MSLGRFQRRFALAAMFCILAAACGPDEKDPMIFVEQAQAATDPAKIGRLQPGSEAEKQALQNFYDFFTVFTAENIKARLRKVYAPDIWFNDTLKSIHGIDPLEAYLLRSVDGAESCTLDILDTASHDGEYYVRWRMHIRFKKLEKGKTITTIGITHLRFNPQGQVTYHQDYWDSASGLYEHVPVLGWAIRRIKSKL